MLDTFSVVWQSYKKTFKLQNKSGFIFCNYTYYDLNGGILRPLGSLENSSPKGTHLFLHACARTRIYNNVGNPTFESCPHQHASS